MNSHIIKNVADSLSNQDVATKNYVNKNAITTDGGVVYGDIKLIVGSDLVRSLFNESYCRSEVYTSAGDRHKYADVLNTQFRITSAYQNKN